MNFRTIEDMNGCICNNMRKIPRDIDLVVGIPRSGILPASLLGLYLNLPIADLHSFVDGKIYQTGSTRKNENWIKSLAEVKHVLIVDDSVSTGNAVNDAKSLVMKLNLDCKVTYCAIYVVPTAIFAVDIYFEVCNHPRIFEWNYLHSWILEYACVDIDGVLCEDPNLKELISKDKYKEFLANAKPKFIPTHKIAYLVTGRSEDYRELTEKWLDNFNIKYENLVMLPKEKASSVMGNAEYGEYKASVYKKTNCFLFIESNHEQAVIICEKAGKQVFCVESRLLVSPDNLAQRAAIVKRDGFITLKRIIKKILKKL